MAGDVNVTGRWMGNYVQSGNPCPIAADLVQAGERLTGSMRDAMTDRTCSVTKFAEEAGLPPGGDEQIVDRLRRMFPDAPVSPIRYLTHLPPDSDLEGRVRGPEIYFLKTYQGTHYNGYLIGGMLVGYQRDDHAVHYRGRVSADGEEIEGQWWIDPLPGQGVRRTEGSFPLRRQEESELSLEEVASSPAQLEDSPWRS